MKRQLISPEVLDQMYKIAHFPQTEAAWFRDGSNLMVAAQRFSENVTARIREVTEYEVHPSSSTSVPKRN